MLVLKSLEHTPDALKVVYTVEHQRGELRTVLRQDLHLVIDPKSGAVTGELMVKDIAGANLPEAIERLAGWCERLAAALREPMAIVTSVPVFRKDYEALSLVESGINPQTNNGTKQE